MHYRPSVAKLPLQPWLQLCCKVDLELDTLVDMSGKVRKQWQLQGQQGAKGSLRRLRSQLAEDGCAESQLVIAKQLLEDSNIETDDKHSQNTAVEAVGWLIKSAELANADAVCLLRECFSLGKGITNKNYRQVKLLLELDSNEREFCVTARKIFNALTITPDDYVTTNQLTMTLGIETEDINLQFSGCQLSEAEFVNVASKLCKGEMPKVILPTPERLSSTVPSSKLCVFWQLLSSSHTWFLETISSVSKTLASNLCTWHQFQIILLLFLCNVLTLNFFFIFCPLFIFYVGLFAMTTSSFQLVVNSYSMPAFTLWLKVFTTANRELDLTKAKTRFLSKCGYFYGKIAISFIVTMFAFPHCEPTFIFSSVLFGLAVIMSFMLWLNLNTRIDMPFIVHTVVCMLSAFSRQLKMLEIGLPSRIEFRFHDYLMTVGVLIISLVILVKSRSVYKGLMPNLTAMMWLYVSAEFSKDLELSCALCALLGWIVIIFCPLAFALGIILLILYFLSQSIYFSATFLCILGVGLFLGELFLAKKLLGTKKYWKLMAFALQSIVVTFLISWTVHLNWTQIPQFTAKMNEASALDWETYQHLCQEPGWIHDAKSNARLACNHLTGTMVSWEGQVVNVALANVQNPLEDSIQSIPSTIADNLRCLFGSSYHRWCAELHGLDYERCSTIAALSSKDCHLRSWDKMTFRVIVQMNKGYWNSAEVELEAGGGFQDFVTNLHPGDVVQYTGSLTVDLLKLNLRINLLSINCKACAKMLTDINSPVAKPFDIAEMIMKSVKFLAHILHLC